MNRLGIIAALPAEAKCLYRKKLKVGLPVEIQKGIYLCLSGIGHEPALSASKKLLALKVDGLVSWGVAGAIDESLNSGELILPETIISNDKRYLISSDWLNRVTNFFQQSTYPSASGNIASSKEICASVTDKELLLKKTGALAVDMESAAIAEIATAHGLDFLVIRAISDKANTAIPEAVLNHTDNLGQPRILKFMLSCLLKPAQIKEIFVLAAGYKMGLKSLSGLAPDLKNKHFFYSDG